MEFRAWYMFYEEFDRRPETYQARRRLNALTKEEAEVEAMAFIKVISYRLPKQTRIGVECIYHLDVSELELGKDVR
jgi:hypothetical protein